MTTPNWTAEQIPDQTGRVAIVTGSNTGIGFETARALARKGARVVMACRNAEKAAAARDRLLADRPAGTVETAALDLADLESVAAFATRFAEQNARLDLLILNAGVMVPPASRTAQGFELQFGVNHLGHFALTGALLPMLRATDRSRVVVVSSRAAEFGAMALDDVERGRNGYGAWMDYGRSKLANLLFARELQRRLRVAGAGVSVTAAHPGYTATDLQRTSVAALTNPVFGMKPPQGALPTLRAATDPGAAGGDYFGPRGLMQMRGNPKKVSMPRGALDDAAAERLWRLSENLTGVSFGL